MLTHPYKSEENYDPVKPKSLEEQIATKSINIYEKADLTQQKILKNIDKEDADENLPL